MGRRHSAAKAPTSAVAGRASGCQRVNGPFQPDEERWGGQLVRKDAAGKHGFAGPGTKSVSRWLPAVQRDFGPRVDWMIPQAPAWYKHVIVRIVPGRPRYVGPSPANHRFLLSGHPLMPSSLLRRVLPFLVAIVAAGDLLAQTTIRGTVTDASSGEPLVAANIQVQGTYRGTVTNAEGVFELVLDALPATLFVRFIGYERYVVRVDRDVEILTVALRPAVYELEELVVTGEDPARSIMRKVIERKQEWFEEIATWQAQAYTRFVARNDTGIVAISESASSAFWDRDRGFREVSLGGRSTENLDLPERLPAAMVVTNLYDDNIEIAGFTFIGPTHPSALDRYDFRLTGRRKLGETTVYDISMEPQSRLVPLFRGTLSVLDSAYALIDVRLEPNEVFFFPPPINDFRVSYEQQFSNFGRSFWLPVDFRSRGALDFGIPGLRFPTIRFDQLSRIADYEVNVALPDSLFDRDELVVERAPAEGDSTRFETLFHIVPLSTEEQRAYESIDSTYTLQKAYKPQGALARFIRTSSSASDEEASVTMSSSMNLQEPAVWYNRVDGLYLGIRPRISRREVTIDSELGRSLVLERWTAALGISYRVPFGRIGAAYREGTTTRLPSAQYSRTITGMAFLAGASDYNDYYASRGWRADVTISPGNRLPSLQMGFRSEEHSSLRDVITEHVFGFSGTLRANPGVADGRENAFSFTLTAGAPSSFAVLSRRAEVRVEVSREALGSDFQFVTASAAIDWRFPTFGRRRLIPNALDVRLAGFSSTGSVPPQRWMPVESALTIYRPFGTLRGGSGRPFEGDEGAALFWEHHFRTIPFEILGLRRLARMGTSLTVFGAHATTRLRPASAGMFEAESRTTGGVWHEAGASVSNILGIPLRADLTHAFRPGTWFVSVGLARLF